MRFAACAVCDSEARPPAARGPELTESARNRTKPAGQSPADPPGPRRVGRGAIPSRSRGRREGPVESAPWSQANAVLPVRIGLLQLRTRSVGRFVRVDDRRPRCTHGLEQLNPPADPLADESQGDVVEHDNAGHKTRERDVCPPDANTEEPRSRRRHDPQHVQPGDDPDVDERLSRDDQSVIDRSRLNPPDCRQLAIEGNAPPTAGRGRKKAAKAVRRRKRPMSDEQRRAVAERMRKYWAARREAKAQE